MSKARIWVVGLLLLAAACSGGHGKETLSHGRFKHVAIYRPKGEVKQFVLLLSGDGGWSDRLAKTMAAPLVAEGAMVAGIDTPELFEDLMADGGTCVFPAGDFENLSHYIQAYYKLPTYLTPVLIGYSSGATLAYALLAQAPAGTFAGAVSMSFCVDFDLRKPLCKGENVRFLSRRDGGFSLLPAASLHAPWIALHGESDAICPATQARAFAAQIPGAQFVLLPKLSHDYSGSNAWLPQYRTAFSKVAPSHAQRLPVPPATLADLPIVEVPSAGNGDTFAVLLSGDGGWAGLDKQVADALAAQGIPVAGFDSLRYFWSPRTPAGLSADLDRVIRYYAGEWHRSHALLIGYSQGADVLPFAVNRLPPATRAILKFTTLIGPSATADFEFHLANWVGNGAGGLPLAPEVARLSAVDTVCLYGDDDADSICPRVAARNARVVELPGGHHFGGDYQQLAATIMRNAPAPASTVSSPPAAQPGAHLR